MRIRLYRAFASNNSGSYTLVGRFRDEATAADAAAALAALCDAHSAWYEANYNAASLDGSPLHAFAREHGLASVPGEVWDHWQEHGSPPRVLHVGSQVLVLVPYTVSMPGALGEYMYKRGGRVELEIEHGHDRLAAELVLWNPSGDNSPAAGARLDALLAQIEPELPALTEQPPYDRAPRIAPVLSRTEWGQRRLTAIFADPAAAILRVRELARAAGAAVHVRLFEVPYSDPDPFAALRNAGPHPAGRHRVALWSAGADRIAVMKLVRELTGCGLAEARARIDALPAEILQDVAQGAAEDAARRLREAGADAEAFTPEARTPG